MSAPTAYVEAENNSFPEDLLQFEHRLRRLIEKYELPDIPLVHQPAIQCDFFEDAFLRDPDKVLLQYLTSRQHVASAVSSLGYSYNQRQQDHDLFSDSLKLVWMEPLQYDGESSPSELRYFSQTR